MKYYTNPSTNQTHLILDEAEREMIVYCIEEMPLSHPDYNQFDLDIIDRQPGKLYQMIQFVDQGGEQLDPTQEQIKKLNMARRKAGFRGVKYAPDANSEWLDAGEIHRRMDHVRQLKKKKNQKPAASTNAQDSAYQMLFDDYSGETPVQVVKSTDPTLITQNAELKTIMDELTRLGYYSELSIYERK